jgi:hypothetical protein
MKSFIPCNIYQYQMYDIGPKHGPPYHEDANIHIKAKDSQIGFNFIHLYLNMT